MISLLNISKKYRDGGKTVSVLSDYSVDIQDKEFAVIIGHSGCGKTTLLNIIGGLLRPDNGDVIIDGQSYYHLSKAEQCDFRSRTFGYVFQEFYLIDDLSLIDNVIMTMQNNTVSRKDKHDIATGLLTDLGLGDRIKWKIKNLSGGERQRVAIARALANDHKMILCDEPTGSLDQESADDIMNVLLGLKQKGKTVIVVTHNTKYAAFSDHLIDFEKLKR